MSNPLSFMDGVLFFLGFPKIVDGGTCIRCNVAGQLIDLGDGDTICSSCWDSYIPSYEE